MKIKLAGDIWAENKKYNIDKNLLNADLILSNLETPITNSDCPIAKAGPSLKGGKKEFLENILSLFCKENLFLTLANNHTGDFGEKGIYDTINLLNELNIKYSGLSINNEYKPYTIKTDEGVIAVFAIGEKQFGVSGFKKTGINYFSPKIYQQIKASKERGDFVIISIHAAAEMFPFISPYIRELYRSFIDLGADIVHSHHSHIPQGFEEYKGGLIFYGLGNFLFNPKRFKNYKNSNYVLLPEIAIEDGKIKNYSIKTLNTVLNNNEVDYIETDLIEYFKTLNLAIKDEELMQSLWQEFSIDEYNNFYSKCFIKNRILSKNQSKRTFFKKFKEIVHILCGDYSYLIKKLDFEGGFSEIIAYHFFSCFSHQYAIETALGILTGEIQDLRNEKSKHLFNEFYKK